MIMLLASARTSCGWSFTRPKLNILKSRSCMNTLCVSLNICRTVSVNIHGIRNVLKLTVPMHARVLDLHNHSYHLQKVHKYLVLSSILSFRAHICAYATQLNCSFCSHRTCCGPWFPSGTSSAWPPPLTFPAPGKSKITAWPSQCIHVIMYCYQAKGYFGKDS